MPGEEEQLTLPQIAELLSLNPSTIRLWVNEKRLPAHRVGRKWFVRRADLEQLLEQQPHIGHPRRRGATRNSPRELPSDWSEVPEEVTLNLARSTELIKGIR
jgi:excisionase family DNA binding protein